VVGLLSDERREYEEAVLTDVKKLGGQTLTLGETNTDVSFHSGLPESARGVLYLPFLQLMAYYRAKSFGLNPDQPRNLTAVVELDFSEQK
jgi:glucosamine--fructose-6-phosphate aminotransferase (isomerizing)